MMLKKLIALFACLLLLTASLTALAEETTLPELSDDSVVVTINGEDVTWLDVRPWYNSVASQYGAYYAEEWLRANALETAFYERILLQKGKELGLDSWTEEQAAAALTTAQTTWAQAIDSYVSNYGNITETSTEEDKTAAKAEAEAYYVSQGYSVELLADWERVNTIIANVQSYMNEQCAVTDADVQARYDERLAADRTLDVAGYESAVRMAQYYSDYGFEMPLYQPAGFRSVKHIFLTVDSALMEDYTDKLARIEEQMDSEASEVQSGEEAVSTAPTATADPAATAEPTEAPVTQADVDAAKQAILDSIKDKITDIQTRIAAGEDFDALIAEYGEDNGMKVEPTMTEGYPVSMDSISYDSAFTNGCFTVGAIGEVTEPIVSSMGVHIIKYVGDLAEGDVALTDELKASISNTLLSSRIEAMYYEWVNASTVEYSGLITPMAELQARDSAAE